MRLLFRPSLIKTFLIPYPNYLFQFHSPLLRLPPSTSFYRNPVQLLIPPSPAPRTTPMATVLRPSSITADEEGIAHRLWVKSHREAALALYTPFIVCLAAGNLNIRTFRHYIGQDVHFLKAFAQAYELAKECADDDDAKGGISELRKSVLEELKMHDSFAQEWVGDLDGDNTPDHATLKYIDFLLSTASGKVGGVKGPGKLATPFERTKVAAYTLGAMTPCMRLYACIGKELQALLGFEDGSSHVYKKWIDSYACEDFQASACQTEDLLDKLSVSLTGEELDVIGKLYNQAMKLEIEFFSAQPLVQKTVIPLLKEHSPIEDRLILFVDFDLTCTLVDSCAILAEIAIRTATKSDHSQVDHETALMSSTNLRNTWEVLSRQYAEDHERCIESILSSKRDGKFSYENLCKALDALAEFEKQANSRVIQSGVFKGLNLEDIKRAGERIIFQDGCMDFFQSIMKNKNLNTNVHVISLCWCMDLVTSAFTSGDLNAVNIYTNEFVYEESVSTGEIVKKVESPMDKVRAFSEILKNCSNDRRNLTVYVGDSVGDLLCLLKADVGIVLGSSSSLRRVGSYFGISFVPLFSGVVHKQKECAEGSSSSWKGSGILYTVSSWSEIHAFVLGS